MMNDMPDPSSGAWTRVRGHLKTQIGKDAYQNWIDPLAFVGADHGIVRIAAPNTFIGTWVQRNYGEAIRHLLAKEQVAVNRLEFTVAACSNDPAPPTPPRVPARAPRTSAPSPASDSSRP